MAALLEVGVVAGVPNSGDGEAATINALMAMVATAAAQSTGNAALASILAKLSATITVAAAAIANGQSLSGAVDLGTGRLVNIQMPAAWTDAVLSFQTSADGVTYADLFDVTGSEYTVYASASRSIVVPRDAFIGTRYLKIRSGLSGAAVAQGGDRSLSLTLV